MITIQLKPKKEDSILRFHPWIFSGAIAGISGKAQEGDLARIVDCNRDFLGIGHYQIGSIAVRIITFSDEDIDINFWKNKIRLAYLMRKRLGLVDSRPTNAYRLVHGEGDNLSGLVIDIYNSTAVIQAHSVGMHCVREFLAKIITEEIPNIKNVYYKSENTLPFKANLNFKDGYLIENQIDCIAKENDFLFNADWLAGQKTGFFIDQRENRSLLEHYAKNKDVLNMFCYTGGFSLYAMRGGAKSVHSVDSSERAIVLTDRNIELNFANDSRHTSFCQNAFNFLENIDGKYDLIVLDPPAFAKHRDALKNALQAYKRLNAKAFKQIKNGGIVFTFSCSQAVSKEQFRLAVFSAAAQSRRTVKILHQLSQAADHPVNIYHPEGEYLKGLVLYVE
ncbi:MAG: class I SAM-dependent rRNA methyltransferase [Prevotellaceae bacterium]|nr:class I SAM-dependent rRNA methyltransferase [Prevotellaceae bacterium]